MYFLTREEARALEKKLRRQIAEQPKPKLVLYYESGSSRDYANAAQVIVAAIGAFSQATVLFQFCVTGDGWGDYERDHKGWRAYRAWRTAAGETSRLYDAPGHQFEVGEAAQLARVIELALWLGWDALVAASPKRQLSFLSHDDRMEIYRGFDRRRLAERLIALGTGTGRRKFEAGCHGVRPAGSDSRVAASMRLRGHGFAGLRALQVGGQRTREGNMRRLAAAGAIVMAALLTACSGGPSAPQAAEVKSEAAAPAFTTYASGLRVDDTRIGKGPFPKPGQICVMHYTGWLYQNGQKGAKFDSSVDRGKPFEFQLAKGQVIRGWDEGVAGMKVGGRRTLIIPPDLGYGGTPRSGIPAYSTLIFEVELLAVKG